MGSHRGGSGGSGGSGVSKGVVAGSGNVGHYGMRLVLRLIDE